MTNNNTESRFTDVERALQAFGINIEEQMNAIKVEHEYGSLMDTGALYWKNGEPWFRSYIDNEDVKADNVRIELQVEDVQLIHDAFKRANFTTDLIHNGMTVVVNF